MTYRVDTFEVRPARRTDQGFLIAQGRVGRAGVLRYQNPDGSSRRELVPEDELTRKDSLGSIGLKPVTDTHPPDGLVTRENARIETKGVSLQRVKYMDGYVDVEILITDPDLADKVERGDVQELSMGYTLERLDETPGTDPKYGEYDAIQRGRIANHIAVVERGRAGPGVRLRVDADDTEDIAFYRDDNKDTTMADEKQTQDTDRSDDAPDLVASAEALKATAQTIADSVASLRADAEEGEEEHEYSDALQGVMDAMGGFVEQMDEYKKNASAQMDKYDEMRGQLDALMSDFQQKEDDAMSDEKQEDGADGVNDTTESRQDQASGMTRQDMLDWHNERKDLEAVAADMRIDAFEDLGNPELRKKIVEEHMGEERADASDEEIKGAYRMVKRIREKRADSYDQASKVAQKSRTDARPSAQQAYNDKLMNSWRPDAGGSGADQIVQKLAKLLND